MEEIRNAILKLEADAFMRGLQIGLGAAERIKVWWEVNPKLVNPNPPELLQQWGDKELDTLRELIKIASEKSK